MTLPAGTRLGPYEIDSLIGAGGMGEVYKARDLRLHRTVAIKRVTGQRPEGFETEARAIAALNHPHICQIYDVGDDYLVLEYLQGEALHGPAGVEGAVRLAIQIADALDTAHVHGVLHRDLKPANVMVVRKDGVASAKLLDFGIARRIDPNIDITRTETGELTGTPAYMSPEQAQNKAVDVRSDIFSFGALVYELLSGFRAFPGNSVGEVLSAVLRDDPRPLDAPAALQRIVLRCLAKDPAQRFQTMREVKDALERVTLEHDVPPSIAVLPFANLSPDKENEYFADGLAEEIINVLAQVGDLKVIARTSAFAFKDKHEDIRHIAQALGVSHVLEGSVRRAAERIRVTAQLIAAADGAHLWSERFDRPMTDVFALQDEIATAIATALKGRLIVPAATRQYTPDMRAYDCLLRGRAHLTRFAPDAWGRAKVQFERAIALDPRFAEPHAELALGFFIWGMHGMTPMRDVVPHVRAQVERAMQLSPHDARPRLLLGAVSLVYDYDWDAARAHFDAALQAGNLPAYARWIHASLYLRGHGRMRDAAIEMWRAVELDPLNATWHAILSAHLLDARSPAEAIRAAERAVELDPDYFVAEQLLGEALWAAGRRDEAIAAVERAHARIPWSAFAAATLAGMLQTQGQTERADALIKNIAPDTRQAWGMVLYHLLTGKIDGALDWYERMIEQRDPFALIYAWGKITAPLRAHPRWPRLAQQMRLPAAPTT